MAEQPDEVKKVMAQLFDEIGKELTNPLSDLVDPAFILEERLKTFYDPLLSDKERETAMINMAGQTIGQVLRMQAQGSDPETELRTQFKQMQEAIEHINDSSESPGQDLNSSR